MQNKINKNDYITLIARIMMAGLFVWAGYGKIIGYEGTQGYMEGMGVPGVLLPLVILLELGGGLSLIFGFLTKFSALSMALFSIVAAFIFHDNFADETHKLMFIKDICLSGGLLMLFSYGAGKISIDDFIKHKILKK